MEEAKRLEAINILSDRSLNKTEALELLSEVLDASIIPKNTGLEDGPNDEQEKITKAPMPNNENYDGIYNKKYVGLVEADMQKIPYDNPNSNHTEDYTQESSLDTTFSEPPGNEADHSKVISLRRTLTNPNGPSNYHYEGANREEGISASELANKPFIPVDMEGHQVNLKPAPNPFAGASSVSPEDFAHNRRAA